MTVFESLSWGTLIAQSLAIRMASSPLSYQLDAMRHHRIPTPLIGRMERCWTLRFIFVPAEALLLLRQN
jgi:hypothetical protein